MPTYPYKCQDCKRRFEIFLTYADYDTARVVCPKCNSERVQRRIGRIRVARSDESRLENLASPDNLEGLEDDPQALGRMMRRMSREMGEDLGPEFDEVVDRLESGQSPEDIETALPDLGEDTGSSLEDDY